MGSQTLRVVHTRLFAEDVKSVQRMAKERGIAWQTELRLLVRKALKEQSMALLK